MYGLCKKKLSNEIQYDVYYLQKDIHLRYVYGNLENIRKGELSMKNNGIRLTDG